MQDEKDKDYDSDDDLRKEMMAFDERLHFINESDMKHYSQSQREIVEDNDM